MDDSAFCMHAKTDATNGRVGFVLVVSERDVGALLWVILAFYQIFNHFAGDDEPHHRWNKGRAAGGGFCVALHGAGVAFGLRGCGLSGWREWRFGGIHHFQMADAPLRQFLAHHACERANRRFADIRHAKGGGIEFVSCAHGADDGGAGRYGVFRQRQLGGHGVHRINDIIISGQVELRRGIRQIKGAVGVHGGGRVDGGHSCRGDVHLVLPDRFGGGDNLSIDVREGHFVVVNEVEGADTAACKSFHRVTADTSHAENSHPRGGEPPHRIGAQQTLRA